MNRTLVITLLVLAGLPAVVGGIAADDPSGDRSITDTSVEPGETTEVTLTFSEFDNSGDLLVEFEPEFHDVSIESVVINGEQLGPGDLALAEAEGDSLLLITSDDLEEGTFELTYDVTVPDDASGETIAFNTERFQVDGSSYAIEGDDTITVERDDENGDDDDDDSHDGNGDDGNGDGGDNGDENGADEQNDDDEHESDDSDDDSADDEGTDGATDEDAPDDETPDEQTADEENQDDDAGAATDTTEDDTAATDETTDVGADEADDTAENEAADDNIPMSLAVPVVATVLAGALLARGLSNN